MRSGYIGALGIPLIFDVVIFHVLVHYFQLWYPIAFAISCLSGAAVDHYDRPKDAGTLPWSRRVLIVLADGADCYLINIGLIMVLVQLLYGRPTLSRILAAAVISLLAFLRQHLLAMQRRHILVALDKEVLR